MDLRAPLSGMAEPALRPGPSASERVIVEAGAPAPPFRTQPQARKLLRRSSIHTAPDPDLLGWVRIGEPGAQNRSPLRASRRPGPQSGQRRPKIRRGHRPKACPPQTFPTPRLPVTSGPSVNRLSGLLLSRRDSITRRRGVAPEEPTRGRRSEELLRWRGIRSRSARLRADASEKVERAWPRPEPEGLEHGLSERPRHRRSLRAAAPDGIAEAEP